MPYCDNCFLLGEVMQILLRHMLLLERCGLAVKLGVKYEGYDKVLKGFQE
jgi:hypothetical protein